MSTVKKRSPIWQYFDISSENNKYAICLLCRVQISRGGEGKKAGTTAMSNHLRTKHPQKVKAVDKGKTAEVTSLASADSDPGTSGSSTSSEIPGAVCLLHEMETESFDTESFIHEIRIFPCIWDYRCDEYTSKIIRNKAWTTLYEKFIPNYAKKSNKEKHEFGIKLQRKWKSLRDCFNREINRYKNMKNGSAASRKREYIFFNQLSFLTRLAQERATNSKAIGEDETDLPDFTEGVNEEPPIIEKPPPSKKKRTKAPKDDKLIEDPFKELDQCEKVKNTPQLERIPSLDKCEEDKHFLLSLCSDFNQISSEFKIDAKSEILAVIKKYKIQSNRYNFSSQNYYASGQHYNSRHPPHEVYLPSTSHPYKKSPASPDVDTRPESADPQSSADSSRNYPANSPVPIDCYTDDATPIKCEIFLNES